MPRNVFVHDIEFGDQVVLPLSAGHFSGGLLGFVPEELRSQTCSTGSCRFWDLVSRVGHEYLSVGSLPPGRGSSSAISGTSSRRVQR